MGCGRRFDTEILEGGEGPTSAAGGSAENVAVEEKKMKTFLWIWDVAVVVCFVLDVKFGRGE